MAVQNIVESLPRMADWCVLQVDVANAFNTLSRQAILEGSTMWCPAVFNYLKFAYGGPTPLFHRGHVIGSKTGTQQGCPLGPLGFSLGIQDIVNSLSRPGILLNAWYLDDGTLVGDGAAIGATYQHLRAELAKRGLRINEGKCRVWGPGAALAQRSGCGAMPMPEWGPGGGLTVLGTPVEYPGTSAITRLAWERANEDLQESAAKVTKLMDPQCAHHILRSCLDGCKVNHLLRASNAYQVIPLVRAASDTICAAMEDLVGCGLDQPRRIQCGMPLSAGGCGLSLPDRVLPAARIAAVVNFEREGASLLALPDFASHLPASVIAPPLEDLKTRLGANFEPVGSWCGDHTKLGRADKQQASQHWWAGELGKSDLLKLLETVPDRDQARLLEQRSGIGSSWMAAIPNSSLHTLIPPEDYTLGLRWWLGLPLIRPASEGGPPRQCPGCGAPIDDFGDHLLCCARNNFALRHNALQEAVCQVLSTSGQQHQKEVPLRVGVAPDLRPADILLGAWTDGLPCAVDLTVSHGWALAERRRPARDNWRPFLRRREEQKHAKYDRPCRMSGWSFAAMAFGTWGGEGPEAAKVMGRIIKRACAAVEPEERPGRSKELAQHLSLTLMRQIWRLLSGRNYVQ